MLTRLQAIQDIRLGRGIQLVHVGRFTTFTVLIRRQPMTGKLLAMIEDPLMGRWSGGVRVPARYQVRITTRQLLNYIRLHYPRYSDGVVIQADPFKNGPTYKEVA